MVAVVHEFVPQKKKKLMVFLITPTPTRAYQRILPGDSVINSLEDLLDLQDRLECDLYITLPDEYGQRRVFLYDP